MYSVKEKLNHFRQLSSPSAAEADLALLREKSPGNSNLIRYGLAPSKNAEDILFDLLDVVTHDEIVRNRREFLAAQEAEEETDNISDGNENPNPDGEKNPEDEKNEIPVALGEKQEDETQKDDDNPTDEKPTDETPAPKAEEVEQPNEETSKETAEEAEQVTVPEEAPATEAEEVEQPNEETPTETAEEAEQVTVPEEAPATEAEEVEEPKEETSTEAVEEAEQPATEKKSTSPKKKSTQK